MLKEHITASGLSQSEWAGRLGISRNHLSSILSGVRLPSLTLAVRIERKTEGAIPAASWVPTDSLAHEKDAAP